jgi:ribose 5-phosphate isomerase A
MTDTEPLKELAAQGVSMNVSVEDEKRQAAEAAADLVENNMTIGLGTGSTVAYLLPALARRSLTLRCVATSPRTEQAALALGLTVEPFDNVDHFDLAIDGADQVTPDAWLIKGGGAAHTREKIIEASADRFVVMADSTKTVDKLLGPVPVELLEFGLAATVRRLQHIVLRDVPRSPDAGVIADYYGPLDNPADTARLLDATPGVVEHGLFEPALVTELLLVRGRVVEYRDLRVERL